jgi:gliding motility-associated-like protein
VTVHTGDGEAVFVFSARDEAGNPGSEITEGSSFVVDTLIRAGAYQTAQVLCVSEPATRISLPPGAITQDLRTEIVKKASLSSNVLGVYDLIAYDTSMKKLDDLVFRVPVEITFSPELPPGQTGEGMLGIYYWDGVRQHKIQDTWTTLRVDYLGRFTLMRSEAMTSRIMNGWAAPNPFTPNGSGDATDRTVFHVATQHGSADFAVKIYDLNGRLVKSLEDGRRVWDGTDEDGQLVEGGLYIYQIKSGEQILSGTVVVLK